MNVITKLVCWFLYQSLEPDSCDCYHCYRIRDFLKDMGYDFTDKLHEQ